MNISNVEAWLSEQLEPPVGNSDTPRQWLTSHLPKMLLSKDHLKGDTAYALAVSMVPMFPEIVLAIEERGDDIELTFDWGKVEAIWTYCVRCLIAQPLSNT